MSSKNWVCRLPPVCALVAALRRLTGRLRLESRYVGSMIVMEDGQRFRVFRHLSLSGNEEREQGAPASGILVVRFKFARFSQALNRLLSLIPVPLIGGYPGFRQKLWMVQEETGYWQGVYEWESAAAVEAYRGSFVLRLMNRRAEPESISYAVLEGTRLTDFADRAEAPMRKRRRAAAYQEELDETARDHPLAVVGRAGRVAYRAHQGVDPERR